MRASVAILLAIVMMFVMLTALGTQAGLTEDAAVQNGTDESAEAYNMTTQLYNGTGQALGPALAIGGVAAVVLIALGYLVKAGGRGR